MARLKDFTPGCSKMRRRIPDIRPNDASVVLAAQVGEHRVLLGADLEMRGDAGMGWTAIVNAANAGDVKHQGFKVPHHGSHKRIMMECGIKCLPQNRGLPRLPL